MRSFVYGSYMPPNIEALDSEDVVIKAHVIDVAEVFSSCRLFVASLLSGAGMKGKVAGPGLGLSSKLSQWLN